MFGFLNLNPIFVENLFGTGINIYWYGVLITTAVILGIIVATLDCKRKGYSTDLPLDMALIAVIFAVIGARLYYVVFDTGGYFRSDTFSEWIVKVVSIWDGGLAIYGAVIGAAIGLFLYSRFNKKYTFVQLLDLGVAPLALGQAIGRWGNFFNQEAFGNPVTRIEWQWFPYALFMENPKDADPGWYQATFFYESMWCLALAVFLYWFFKKQKYAGQAMILYFTLYGFERSLVELLRQDSLLIPGTGIRVSSLLSALLCLTGVALLLYFSKHLPKPREKKIEMPESEEPKNITEESADEPPEDTAENTIEEEDTAAPEIPEDKH